MENFEYGPTFLNAYMTSYEKFQCPFYHACLSSHCLQVGPTLCTYFCSQVMMMVVAATKVRIQLDCISKAFTVEVCAKCWTNL